MRSKLVFHIEAQDVPALRSHALLNQYTLAQSDEAEICEIYFDTPDLLLKARYTDLSLQTNQKDWIQSLNIADDNNISNFTGGMLRWCNCSAYVASGQLDLSRFGAADLLKPGQTEMSLMDDQYDNLQEIFRAHYSQHVWMLQLPDGSQASCAINQGNTGSASQCAEFCELEFELHKGNMLQLFDFVDTVMQCIPLTTRCLNRKEQGYALYRSQPAATAFAKHLYLNPEHSINEALDHIVTACLVQIQSNQAGVAMWRNRECLHQMRIGIRRLSAAQRMCKKIQPFPDLVREEVKWLDTQLGKARDWDVFTAMTLPQLLKLRAAKAADRPLIKTLLRAASAKARNAHDTVSTTLTSPRYARLILNLLRWQYCLSEQAAQKSNNTNLARFSHHVIEKEFGRLRKGSLKTDALLPEDLHKLRKKIKVLRYTVEFFRALYPIKSMRRSMKSIATVLDLLGASNDFAVCAQLIHELLLDNPELQQVTHHIPRLLKKQSKCYTAPISKSLTKLLRIEPALMLSGRQRL